MIRGKPANAWKKEIPRAAEKKNKDRMMEDCIMKVRGEAKTKTKTKSLVHLLENEDYTRKPEVFMHSNNKLIARAFIMGRYGMLQCASNYSMGSGGKMCRNCGITDDENYRINDCVLWATTNLFNSHDKLDFDTIHSDDEVESMKVVERVLMMWDLANGKNIMRNSI